MSLSRLNAVRIFIVLFIAIGYTSTMPSIEGNEEVLRHLGYDPSWFGIQILFCVSGYLALRSLTRHGSAKRYLTSRILRNIPLLAAYTFAVVSVIYPLFCDPHESFAESIGKLGIYFAKTVSLFSPGDQLPGLLDNAKYMCLIQGAIWTFRWGALAHIIMAIGWRLGFLKSKTVLLALAILATAFYGISYHIGMKYNHTEFEPLMTGARLGYAFLSGAALWGWQHKLPKSGRGKLALLSALMGAALFHYYVLPWTPLIEILGTAFWTYLAISIIQTPMRATDWMANWPNIALGLYIGHWPVSQTLIALYPDMHGTGLIVKTIGVTALIALITHAAISGHINVWAANFLRRKVAI